MVYNLLL